MLKDFIGRELNIGDVVAFPNTHGALILARIEEFSKYQLKCTPLHGHEHDHVATVRCYAQSSAKLDQNEVTMYLLKRDHDE